LRREEDDYEAIVDVETRRWRIGNVLLQAVMLCPSVRAVTLAGSREEARYMRARVARHVYPFDYEPALPACHHPNDSLMPARRGEAAVGVLRATPGALRSVERWLRARAEGRKIVTVTIRAYAYMPGRNSNSGAWTAFARRLDPAEWFVVFVPDTDQVLQQERPDFGVFTCFGEAAWNLDLRMALYELAFLNLGVNSGPMALCWLNERTRYITFKILTPSLPQATPEFMRWQGFEVGHSLPFAGPFQKWVWADDDVDVIEREFREMVPRIQFARGSCAASA
jgi:hypothetical protein